MRTSRRADQIAQLKTRRQEIAARAKDADKRVADRLRQLADARDESGTQAGDPAQDHHRGHRPGGTEGERGHQPRLLDEQIQARKRPDDRALFGLDGEPPAGAAEADKAEPAAARPCPPVTARQKKLLAKLVEEHPELAREFGVDPDEPKLEELGKAKAASLLRAMADRLNAQAPPDER